MGIDALFEEIARSALSADFDPAPVRFTRTHERGVAPMKRVLNGAIGVMQPLARQLSRNEFLCGCLDFTEHQPIEHLIVGFGTRHGASTTISFVRHDVGGDHQVGVTAHLFGEIKTHLHRHAKAEVVVFHNHPRTLLNNVVDNEPIASSADRGLLTKMAYLDPLNLLRALLGHGTVRFFLGENGYVREFTAPDILDVLQRLRMS